MMKIKNAHIIAVILGLLITSSCLRLDSFMFNNSVIEEYLLDDYPYEVDFILNESYNIHDTMIHLFVLESKLPEETTGVDIYSMYIGDINRIDTDTVVLYCHGNKDHMDFYWPRAKLLANAGEKNRYGIMTFDYRGFGLSEGIPTEEGMYADVEAALSWLKEKGLTNDRLIVYGFSMGSAPATKISAEDSFSMKPSKLILENPFASFDVMVHDGAALTLPGSYISNLEIDNAEKIKDVNQAFMWIHGIDDSFLSIESHGEVIYKNYSGIYGEAHRVPDAEHSTVPQTLGFEDYNEIIEAFVTY